ncbi:MFS transporter [Nocardioides ochotonae]|uniref:MFS transporter n=1 Tax=Nocardioides ochotonae TaxID=2685869 RepID=UPI0014095662|nr:MFS transporter [Nocardioides ochotonae]
MTSGSTTTPRSGDAAPGAPRPAAVIIVLCAAGICVALVQAMIFPLVPSLPGLLDTSAADATWVVSATLMAAAVATPVSGRLGDMVGKRRVILASLGFLILGSLVCAASSSLLPMIVGRALQGLAMGTIPLGISVMREELTTRQMATGIAVMSATMGIGGSIGMPLSALVLAVASWRAMFLLVALLASVCAVAVLVVVPPSRVARPGRFDLVGALGLAVVLVAFLLVVTRGQEWGWASPPIAALALLVVVVLAWWTRFELRRRDALVDLRVAARPTMVWANLAALALGFSMYPQGLAFPQMMNAPASTGYGLGLDMVIAGLVIGIGGLTMLLLAPLAARFIVVRGARVSLMVAGVLVAVSYLVPLVWYDEPWYFALASIVMCAGLAFGMGALPQLVMSAVPVGETGAANGVNALMRSLGLAVSGAVVSIVLASSTLDAGGATYPTLGSLRLSYAVTLLAALLVVVCAWRVPRAGVAGVGAVGAGPAERS